MTVGKLISSIPSYNLIPSRNLTSDSTREFARQYEATIAPPLCGVFAFWWALSTANTGEHMNMNSNDQSAAQAKAWMNHIEMERQSQAVSGHIGGSRQLNAQVKSTGNQERAPVQASLARLTELIDVLECRAAVLTDRLAAVLRPSMLGAGGPGSDAEQSPSCVLEDELSAMATRIESVIERIDSTRNRLCI